MGQDSKTRIFVSNNITLRDVQPPIVKEALGRPGGPNRVCNGVLGTTEGCEVENRFEINADRIFERFEYH